MFYLGGRGCCGIEVDGRDLIVVDNEGLSIAFRRVGRMTINAVLNRSSAYPRRAIGTRSNIRLYIHLANSMPKFAFSGQFHIESEAPSIVTPPDHIEAEVHPSINKQHNIVNNYLLIDITTPAEYKVLAYERNVKIVTTAMMLELPDDILSWLSAISRNRRHKIWKLHAEAVDTMLTIFVDGSWEASKSELAARITTADICWVIQHDLVGDGKGSIVGARGYHVCGVLGCGEIGFDTWNQDSVGASRRVARAHIVVLVCDVHFDLCRGGRCEGGERYCCMKKKLSWLHGSCC